MLSLHTTPVNFRYLGETYKARKKHAPNHLYSYGNPYVRFPFVYMLVMRGLPYDMIRTERNGKELGEQLGKFVGRDNVAITFNSKEILLLFRHASDADMIIALHPGGPYRNFTHIFDNATYVTSTRPGHRHQHGIEFTYSDLHSPDDDDRQSQRLARIFRACRCYSMVSHIQSSCTSAMERLPFTPLSLYSATTHQRNKLSRRSALSEPQFSHCNGQVR